MGADWLYLLKKPLEEGFSPGGFEIGVPQLLSNRKCEKFVVVVVVKLDPVVGVGHHC